MNEPGTFKENYADLTTSGSGRKARKVIPKYGTASSPRALAVRDFGAYLTPDALFFAVPFFVKSNKIKVLRERPFWD